MKLDNPVVVQWEYASEERLATRNETYRSLVEGVNAEELAYGAIRTFAGASITRAHLASDVPEITEPFRTSSAHAVFVAEKAA